MVHTRTMGLHIVVNACAAALIAPLLVSGCTGQREGGQPHAGEPETQRAPDASVTTPLASESPESTEPLVLVTRADRGRVRLTVRAAETFLAGGQSEWRVLHASGTGGVAGRELRDHATVLRRVGRHDAALGVLPASAVDATVRPVLVGGVDPLRRPDAYPLQVTGAAPGPVTQLTVVGDVMLARGVSEPERALAPMMARLASADLTIGTLESTLSEDGRPQQGGDSFAADPRVVPLLAEAGFDAVSVANNHVGDFEVPAMLKTLRLLRSGGVVPFGAGRDLGAASRAAVLEQDGMRFGFIGFNAIGETPRATRDQPGALSVRMPPRTGPLVQADLRHVVRLVRRLSARVDAVVVLPHWGTQYTHVAEPIQHRVARRLAAAGADLVVGGHPHWVQGLARIGDTVVAHSLGNFVFDMDFMTETQQGIVLETTWWGAELKGIELVPYRMDHDFAPRVVRGGEADDILRDVWDHSHGPFSAR